MLRADPKLLNSSNFSHYFCIGLCLLKIGSILYGSGYVLAAFLQGGLVDARHWLTQTQLLDAIAVGQFTPGPVLSTATFIGFLILGFPGAVVSTVGIFLPSFVYVLAISPFVPKLRKSASTAGFLDAVNAASLGLMLAVCVILGIATLVNPGSWIYFHCCCSSYRGMEFSGCVDCCWCSNSWMAFFMAGIM